MTWYLNKKGYFAQFHGTSLKPNPWAWGGLGLGEGELCQIMLNAYVNMRFSGRAKCMLSLVKNLTKQKSKAHITAAPWCSRHLQAACTKCFTSFLYLQANWLQKGKQPRKQSQKKQQEQGGSFKRNRNIPRELGAKVPKVVVECTI